MIILIYITAILVSIILERQERRHNFELAMEYRRLGKSAPEPKPKLNMIQSWLNIVVGVIISYLGVLFLVSNFYILKDIGKQANEMTQWYAVILATGIALVIVGVKSVRMNRKYNLDKN